MNIVDRARKIMLEPKAAWAEIAPEPTDPKTLYTSYVVILAIIPAVASFLSLLLFTGPFGVRVGFGVALTSAVMQYVLSLVMVFVVAFIADALAPGFDGHKDLNQALKLTAYAMTAAWVAGAFVIVPWIGWLLSLIGTLYSLYLFFLGVPLLMRVPEQKAVVYTVVVVVVAILVNVVIGIINGYIVGGGPAGMMGGMPRF
ncbi:MAG: YIP1 family protein [Betaproteobacteria bacterium]|nr:YIP1 family protein [Betaproteobacteria bacterium]